jgi:hypothetical protein
MCPSLSSTELEMSQKSALVAIEKRDREKRTKKIVYRKVIGTSVEESFGFPAQMNTSCPGTDLRER